MAPLPEYDTYISLSYPSVSAFVSGASSGAHLAVISSAARRSDSLLVSVKTRSDSDIGTGTGSSTSSGSSSRPPPPSALWLALERSLAEIYSCATREFLRSGRVLARVDVVIDHVRQLAICPPRTCSNVVHWDYSEEPQSARPHDPDTDRIRPELQDSYQVVALGGTFDHLHAGHKILLTMACSIATRKIIVGVSDDELLGSKQYRQHLESITDRIHRVEDFIQLVRPTIERQVVSLKDVYGPTATDPDIQALVVSEETRSGGDAINKLRSERGLSKLDTFVINLVSDDGSTTSTTKTTTKATTDAAVATLGDESVKVAVETKMGSTGIRAWIEEQQVRSRSSDDGNRDKR